MFGLLVALKHPAPRETNSKGDDRWGANLKNAISAALTAVAFLVALQFGAKADGVTPPSDAPEQLFVAPYPAAAPWKMITNHRDDGQVWIEWIPANQNEDDIRDILTEQIFFAQKGDDPSAFVDALLQRINRVCRATRRNGPKAQTELGYSIAYAQVYCVGNSNKDVDIFIKAIAGHDALYVVQREFRRPATPDAMPGVTVFNKDQLAEAQARLVAQATASKFLVEQVTLCPHGLSGDGCTAAAAPASVTPAAPPTNDSDSTQIDGWPIPGKTTADEVSSRLGRPLMENHSDPFRLGQWTRVYQGKDGLMFTFLFDKNDLVVRMRVFKYSPPH